VTQKKEKKSRGGLPTPIVLSINICDTIIRDEKTKKVSLIGLFSAIHANSFPAVHPSMHIYVALTNGHGEYNLDIRFVRAEDNVTIVAMQGKINFVNPLQVVELNLEWRGLKFDKAGEHHVEVLCNDQPIGTRKFVVNHLQMQIPPTKGTENK
jgi:hypothetical protein